MILFDFSTAFPSLDREFVALVLAEMGVAEGVQNVIQGMYAPSWTSVGRPDGPATLGFCVATGVPQGCPLSGIVFACATVALIKMLVAEVGANNVCLLADDTAVVVDRVQQLVGVRAAFEAYAAATALRLKEEKCVLIPLIRDSTDAATIEAYHQLIAAEVPKWRGFRVALSATYLGVPVGPNVTPLERWRKPMQKYADRVAELARSPLSPPAAVVHHVQVYAAPVLVYAAMTARPVDELKQAEALMWQRALRFLVKALPIAAQAHLNAIGLKKVAPLMASVSATLHRSRVRHTAGVDEAMAELARLRDEVGPLAALGRPELAPDRAAWYAPAHADEMQAAEAPCAPERRDAAAVPPRERRRGHRVRDADLLAEALVPRVRKRFPRVAASDAEIATKCAATIAALAKCAPLLRSSAHPHLVRLMEDGGPPRLPGRGVPMLRQNKGRQIDPHVAMPDPMEGCDEGVGLRRPRISQRGFGAAPFRTRRTS